VPIDRRDTDDTDDTGDDTGDTEFVPGRPVLGRVVPRRPTPSRSSARRSPASRRGARRRRSQVRDRGTARRWFVLDALFVVAAAVALVVGWASGPDDTGLAVFLTVCVVLAAANALWEMHRLWPTTGWQRRAGPAPQPPSGTPGAPRAPDDGSPAA
jgi:hypothetical protein